jgi:hypothetical protein
MLCHDTGESDGAASKLELTLSMTEDRDVGMKNQYVKRTKERKLCCQNALFLKILCTTVMQ